MWPETVKYSPKLAMIMVDARIVSLRPTAKPDPPAEIGPELPGRSAFATGRRPQPSQHGCMRPRITAAVVVACLAAPGVSSCTQSTETCAVADYGGGTSGYQTPQQALRSVLAQHEPSLKQTGWKLAERGAGADSFASGDDRVDVVKNKAGTWNVGGVTVCT